METARWRRRCLLLCRDLIMRWISHLASNGGGLWPLTLKKHYFLSRKAAVSGSSRGRYCHRTSTSYSPSRSERMRCSRTARSWLQLDPRFRKILHFWNLWCTFVDYTSNSGSGYLPFDFCVIWRICSSTTRHLLWKFCCSGSARSQMSVLETRVLVRSSERCDQAQGTETCW